MKCADDKVTFSLTYIEIGCIEKCLKFVEEQNISEEIEEYYSQGIIDDLIIYFEKLGK